MEGLYSHPISFPPWEEENDLELGLHIYLLFGFKKPYIIVMFEFEYIYIFAQERDDAGTAEA